MKKIAALVLVVASLVFCAQPPRPSRLLCPAASGSASGNFTVTVTRVSTGALLMFSSDDASIEGYVAEVYFDGSPQKVVVYCMTDAGGRAAAFANVTSYRTVTVNAWSVLSFGKRVDLTAF